MIVMAGILERIGWSPKRVLANSFPALRVGRRILGPQAAKEILAEIFGISISDVEEMIQIRYEDACYRNKREEWPQEFCLGEYNEPEAES
jgi:hypothetical protein